MQQRIALLFAVPLIAWSCAHSLESTTDSSDNTTTTGGGSTVSVSTVAGPGTGGAMGVGGAGTGGSSASAGGAGGALTTSTAAASTSGSGGAATTSSSSSNVSSSNVSSSASSSSVSSSAASTGAGGGPTGLVVEYLAEKTGASGTAIGSQLFVVNNGNTTVNLSGLTLRYYLTIVNEVPLADLMSNINWAHTSPIVGGSQTQYGGITINAVAMAMPVASADTYLEFSLGGTSLPPNYELQFSWTTQNFASKNFIQTGDYSFNGADVSETQTTKVVLLQGAVVLWGVEP